MISEGVENMSGEMSYIESFDIWNKQGVIFAVI